MKSSILYFVAIGIIAAYLINIDRFEFNNCACNQEH